MVFEVIECAKMGDVENLKQLLKEGNNVNERDELEYTPLIWAASAGNLPAVQFLLSAGADINAANSNKDSALHCATSRKRNEVAKCLLSHKEIKQSANRQGKFAKDIALSLRCPALLELFASVNEQDELSDSGDEN
eukprot:TRINITY_DN9161_c0_g1_i1.p1 TRINITY_DN9161_c0_g1~~TRINITY_DN9161_c0_g1_i1.p1  ORF type:complete len:136 (-),score=26.69 TRINITY_DN9161_c0_g1_i1:41-448(-)